MRKLLIILLACISLSAFGQGRVRHVIQGTSIDSASWTTEWKVIYYNMTEANRPAVDTADKFNDAIYSLDTASILDQADLLYFFNLKNATEALVNLADPTDGSFDCVEVGAGALTHTPYLGFDGDGTNYFNTSYVPSTDATNYALDDGAIAVYATGTVSVAEEFITGTESAGTASFFSASFSGTVYARINQGASINYSYDGEHVFIVSRAASDDVDIWADGSSQTEGTTASSSVPTNDVQVFAKGTVNQYNGGIAMYYLGGNLTVIQRSSLTTIWETLMDYLGNGEL